jgi:5,10-methylenetetrahydromethanopterin reductase
MTDRIGLYLHEAHSLSESIQYARYAEQQGFEAVWQAENRLSRDALVTLAAFATNTSKLKLGSGVVNCWTRNVATLAAAFSTLDELAPDRIIGGIGAWHEPLAAKVGVRRDKPLLALREVVTNLRALLNRERVTFEGQYVTLHDVELEHSVSRRVARRIPLYIAATGPQMMKLTGEIADGALLDYLVSPLYNEGAMMQLEAGARIAGRSLDQLDRVQLIACAVDNDPRHAMNTARRVVTRHLAQQPQVMRASGVSPELLDEIAQVIVFPLSEAQIGEVMRLVPDDVVQMVVAVGTPDEMKRKIREYVYSGVTCPVLYPLCDDVHLLIDTFADGYNR